MISACMLIRTEKGRYQDVVKRLQQVSGVKSAFPVLGRYDVVVDIESTGNKELGRAIMKVNRIAGIVFTETMPEVET
ncbi:MAG: Lrp/AsnC ligand binding domain-containing protein [Candidatus Bathyarchaeia archaeon]